MIWVKKLMGWILVVMAIYFINPLLTEPWGVMFYTFAATAAGFHLGWLEKSDGQTPVFRKIRIVVGAACLVLATFVSGSYLTRAPGIEWTSHPDGVDVILAQAKEDGQPVIIDFSADWCAPCRELDETTFRHPDVRDAAKQIVMVKIDLTGGSDDTARELLEKYQVKGVPTVVFVDRSGRERGDLRLVDFRPPDEFLRRMKQIL
jgi:thiol:disulfide interchange protein DsbD